MNVRTTSGILGPLSLATGFTRKLPSYRRAAGRPHLLTGFPAPRNRANLKQSQSSPTFCFSPTPAIPTTYHHTPHSPLPSFACPPYTMWLGQGSGKAISPRGKGFRTHLSGSPLVNSFGFNEALRIFRTYMSGMGSFMEETTEARPDWIDQGPWVGRRQSFAVIAKKCSAARALSLNDMKESCSHEEFGL